MSPTISVGSNLLFESSFVEQFGSGRSHKVQGTSIINKLQKFGHDYLENVQTQLNDDIMKNNVLHYKPPNLAIHYVIFCHESDSLKILKKHLKKSHKREK